MIRPRSAIDENAGYPTNALASRIQDRAVEPINRASAAHGIVDESVIDVRSTDKLTEDAVREIEQIHSSWIEFEVAGESHRLAALCADDIELWPPDAQPVLGRTAVSAQLSRQTASIHGIEISELRIRGSNEVAYLTSSFKTTLTSAENRTDRQILGSHLWVLEKRAGVWVVVVVTWSLWDRGANGGTPPTWLPSSAPSTT